MKFLRIMFLSTLFVLCCHGFSMAQNELNPYALVRINESSLQPYSQIFISYEDGRIEEIFLPATVSPKSKSGGNDKETLGIITKTINQMMDKGYKIVGVTSNGYMGGSTTYTMEKVR